MCSNLGAASLRHSAGESALKAATMGHQQRKGREQDPSVDKQETGLCKRVKKRGNRDSKIKNYQEVSMSE